MSGQDRRKRREEQASAPSFGELVGAQPTNATTQERRAAMAGRRIAPVTQSVVRAAVPTPASAPAPTTEYTPNPDLYREAPEYDYGKARADMTRAAINMLVGNAPLPQAYRSNVAVDRPDRGQMMAQNLQMERNNKQSDFYDRMRQVGFVTPELLKEALADRRASRTLAAQSVGEAGRQAGEARKSAIEEARLAENASQAEYNSQWKRPEYERQSATNLLTAASQAGQVANQEERNRVANLLAKGQLDQDTLETLLQYSQPDPTTGRAGDPDMFNLLMRELFTSAMEKRGYADGGMVDIHTYADGGEVEVEAPTDEGKLAGLDTGDYVFPVEAVRFYGTKTIKAMVEKAMMAADD